MSRVLASLLGLVVAACTLPASLVPPREPPAPATLRVDVQRGGEGAPALGPADQVPVAILLDDTTSMQERIPGRRARLADAARQLTARYLAALPETTPVELRVLGLTSGTACGTAVPISGPGGVSTPAALGEALATIPPSRGESSLARALEDARRALERRGGGLGGRVVVLSDLDDGCGGDLCAAAGALVEAGVEIELVALNEAPAPACLAELAMSGPPPALAGLVPAEPPTFRVERPARPQAGVGPTLVGTGRAGGDVVELAPGRVVVTVDLDPPAAVGPLDLAPGQQARVRVLDFPGLDPPVRELWVEGAARSDDEEEAPGGP